ncbi:hypothetical protein VOLCADRAFT_98699 [Volvox carteri f. nagariensis]|uniref:Uncharacterized protein n=1 Tax=Volvox carteri f. nagariensis TaxID=3068 RepID=D8UG19_VOLCA|nr:uncharacterized protein VOLCADRAFT_98699 [Volvox carteri f. nagariensis]EFJ41375.1 hypothetical protein VOLCADRAFT_98699 [Volvox carteri f. nagariensis]|eukprot:XP_002957605.1 hypothetical protein VOLCADRAFT_98699 [Volvox carteri f. nagariensis]
MEACLLWVVLWPELGVGVDLIVGPPTCTFRQCAFHVTLIYGLWFELLLNEVVLPVMQDLVGGREVTVHSGACLALSHGVALALQAAGPGGTQVLQGPRESEAIERYCADTGFKELLHCTTDESHQATFSLVLTYPYPPDVHIVDERDEGPRGTGHPGGGGGGGGALWVVRSCTEKTVEAHQEALRANVEVAGGALSRMPLFKFELAMCGLLGLSLPVVYWRKIRIRHL